VIGFFFCLFFSADDSVQSKLPIYCKDESEKNEITAIHWYDGKEGYFDTAGSVPTLAICFVNGKVQIMRNETDESELPSSFIHFLLL
jgi:hypothetical protein